jgi:hypothetical protein
VEADRRHTTTGFECRKSCSESCLDLTELVVDLDADRLKRSRRDVDVTRPGAARDGGLDGRSKIARGAERAPRHDELCDPAGPSLLAVFLEDPLELCGVITIDDGRRGELGAGVHPHVERPVGAEAEPAVGIVDLRAGETEIEEDQVRWAETVPGCDRAKIGEPTVDDDSGSTERSQRSPRGVDRGGIAVDPEQPATWRDPLQDLAGVARLPERGVDRDGPRPGLEQLYYLL